MNWKNLWNQLLKLIGQYKIPTPKPPVVVTPTADKPATGAVDASIDVTGLTRCDPPYTGAYLESAGNDEEVGDPQVGTWWRVLVRYTSHDHCWNICSLAKKGIKVVQRSKQAIASDFRCDGGVYKFMGWVQHEGDMRNPAKYEGKAGEVYNNPTDGDTVWAVYHFYK